MPYFFVTCYYFLYILACVDFKASNIVVSGHEYWLPCGGGDSLERQMKIRFSERNVSIFVYLLSGVVQK